jgi:hypothetical protein
VPPTVEPVQDVDPVHIALRDGLDELGRLAGEEPADAILAGLIEAVLVVLELHIPDPPRQGERPRCRHDHLYWPCPTVTAISVVLVDRYADPEEPGAPA